MSKKQKFYTAEFKAEAIKVIEKIKAMFLKQENSLESQCKPFQMSIIKLNQENALAHNNIRLI